MSEIENASVVRIEDVFGNEIWSTHCTPESAKNLIEIWEGRGR